MLSVALRHLKAQNSVYGKIYAAADLVAQAKEHCKRMTHFSKIAWGLDRVLFFLAGFFFWGSYFLSEWVVVMGGGAGRLPPAFSRFLTLLFQDSPEALKGFFGIILGLLLLPLVLGLLLSRIGRSFSAKASAAETMSALHLDLHGKLRYIDKAFSCAEGELLSNNFYYGNIDHGLCILCALPGLMVGSGLGENFQAMELLDNFGAVVILCVLMELIHLLQYATLSFCFSVERDRRRVYRLHQQFVSFAKAQLPGYLSIAEEVAKAAAKRRWEEEQERKRLHELYGDCTWGDSPPLSASAGRADGDLDAVQKILHETYGDDWLKDM